MNVLFDVSRNVSPEDLQFVIQMIDKMKRSYENNMGQLRIITEDMPSSVKA